VAKNWNVKTEKLKKQHRIVFRNVPEGDVWKEIVGNQAVNLSINEGYGNKNTANGKGDLLQKQDPS
jgi:hypothetical protein